MSEHAENAAAAAQAVGHVASSAAILGVLAGLLPAIATVFAILWYAIAIYETKTVQRWLAGWRSRRHARYLARHRCRK